MFIIQVTAALSLGISQHCRTLGFTFYLKKIGSHFFYGSVDGIHGRFSQYHPMPDHRRRTEGKISYMQSRWDPVSHADF